MISDTLYCSSSKFLQHKQTATVVYFIYVFFCEQIDNKIKINKSKIPWLRTQLN